MSESNSNKDQSSTPTEKITSIRGIVFEVPTTSRSERAEREIDFNIMEVTESSMDALRFDDPFMYYSIFSPTAYPLNWPTQFHFYLVQWRFADVDQAISVRVQRQGCISPECDDATLYMRCIQGNFDDDFDIGNYNEGYDDESGNEEEKEFVND